METQNLQPRHHLPSEFSLTEYPLYLLSRTVPKGTTAIEWQQDIYVNGERVPQRWRLTGNPELGGLPAAPDGEAWMAIRYALHLSAYKSRHVPITTIWSLFRKLGHTDSGTVYRRFKDAIRKWRGVTVQTTYALWDSERRAYERERGFGILDNYEFIERHQPGTSPRLFGHVTINEYAFNRLKNGQRFALDFDHWCQLDHDATRRAYEYLEKQRGRGHVSHSIEIRAFLIKLGYGRAPVERYPLKKCRQLLRETHSTKGSRPAVLETLKQRGFLRAYTFRLNPKSGKTLVVVWWGEPTHRREHPNRYGLTDDQVQQAEGLALHIGDVLGRAEQNQAYYFTVAAQAIAGRYTQAVHHALSETKQAAHDGRIRTTKSQFFTDELERTKAQFDLPLTTPRNSVAPDPTPKPPT